MKLKMKEVILYSPSSYQHATYKEKGEVVNGCGTNGWKGLLVPSTLYLLPVIEACNIHDWMYYEGKSLSDKKMADRVFLNNMVIIVTVNSKWRWLRLLRLRKARIYYEAVKRFGGPAFWSGKNRKKNLVSVNV